MAWPDNPFWDYAVLLYRQPEVEAACLELQRRHGLDVNLVLLCCWLGSRGVALDDATLRRAKAAVAGWQAEVIRPLRAVRRRLKAQLADPEPESVPALWPELTASLRGRTLALEIDGERLAQLALIRAVAGVTSQVVPGVEPAVANLRLYWPFDARDRHALRALLAHAFPDAAAAALEAQLAWLDE